MCSLACIYEHDSTNSMEMESLLPDLHYAVIASYLSTGAGSKSALGWPAARTYG